MVIITSRARANMKIGFPIKRYERMHARPVNYMLAFTGALASRRMHSKFSRSPPSAPSLKGRRARVDAHNRFTMRDKTNKRRDDAALVLVSSVTREREFCVL